MKKLFTFLLIMTSLSAMSQTMKVSGKSLLDVNGNSIVLRGINYQVLDNADIDFNNPAHYRNAIDQVALTGANVIRLPWNTYGVHWRDVQTPNTLKSYVTNGRLSDLITYSKSKGIAVVLEIHDLTCKNDWNKFNNTIVPFWKLPEILQVINENKTNLIVNIANEFGNDNDWGGDLNTFRTNYISAVQQLRTAGITVPIMTDAPNCGSASTSLVNVAADIFNADTQKNVIFSVHTYWSAYAPTTAQITTKMNEMIASPYCFMLGEIANKQDVTGCGSHDITSIYQTVLTQACTAQMSWMAWSFHKDCASLREISNTGQAGNLTAFGNDLVNNATYGLKSTNGCGAVSLSTNLDNVSKDNSFTLKNPSDGILEFGTSEVVSVDVFDLASRKVSVTKKSDSRYKISAVNGIYILNIQYKDGQKFSDKILINN